MSGWDSLSWEAKRGAVLAQALFICEMCQTADAVDVDHIWPRQKGGTDERANLRAACKPCNQRKGASIYLEDLDVNPDLSWLGIEHYRQQAMSGLVEAVRHHVCLRLQWEGLSATEADERALQEVESIAATLRQSVSEVIYDAVNELAPLPRKQTAVDGAEA